MVHVKDRHEAGPDASVIVVVHPGEPVWSGLDAEDAE